MNKRAVKAFSEAVKKHWGPWVKALMDFPPVGPLFDAPTERRSVVKDILGREVYAGMVIAYPGHKGSSHWQSVARVEGTSTGGGLWVTLLQKNHMKVKGQKVVRVTAAVNSLVIVYSNDSSSSETDTMNGWTPGWKAPTETPIRDA